jgi:hypothetical protein
VHVRAPQLPRIPVGHIAAQQVAALAGARPVMRWVEANLLKGLASLTMRGCCLSSRHTSPRR